MLHCSQVPTLPVELREEGQDFANPGVVEKAFFRYMQSVCGRVGLVEKRWGLVLGA